MELRRHGQDLLGLCPFHDDKEPSLVISPEKNLWHCLGACGEGGSVIDWVMKSEGVSFRHAVELLRADTAGGVLRLCAGHAAGPALDGPEAPLGTRPRRRRPGAPPPGGRLLPRDLEGLEEGDAVPGLPGDRPPGGDRALPAGLREPHPGLSPPGQDPEGGRRGPGAPGEARDLARERPRALQRLARDPGLRRDGPGDGDLRAQDHPGAQEAGAPPPLPARPAPGRLERAGPPGVEGGDPHRVADRRADLLVRGLPERHGRLRGQRPDRRPPGGLRPVRHRARAPGLRPGRRRRGGKARRPSAWPARGSPASGSTSPGGWTPTSTP